MNTDPAQFKRLLEIIPPEIMSRVWFFPLPLGKKFPPACKDPQDEKNRLTPQQGLDRLKMGSNVGIYCLPGGLFIIDEDRENGAFVIPNEVITTLPKTLTVQTRNAGRQYYFINNGKFSNKVYKYDGIKAGELRANWYYGVAPGSYVKPDDDAGQEATGLYSIINDAPVSQLEKLPAWMEVCETIPKEEIKIEIEHKGTWKNDLGMPLFEIRKKSPKLDALLNGANESDRSAADMAAVQLLHFWRFTESETAGILQEYRAYEKTARQDYLETTISKIIRGERYNPNYKGNGNGIKSNGAFDYIDKIVEKTPVYYDEAGQFWLWNREGFYRPVDNTEILLTLLIDIADPAIIQTKFKTELLEAARLRGRDARVKPVPTHWIHIQNGVYDIKTGALFEATPDYLFTDPIPHKIGDSEETPTIDKLFSEWVAPEKVKLLNEIAAYCIYNGYPIHRMFILFGSGRNGKGQFRDLIVNLVGRQNRTASTLEQLINSRFETARLFNRKICTMGEINYSMLDRTAILKMLSGGDPIPGEMKNKAPFDFVNTAKLLINTNSLPQTSDKTDAFYSRCILVEFVKQFQLGKNIIETIPQEEYDNFLTKSLRVLRELLDRGEFTNEGDIRAKEVEYERVSNPLTQFINTFYEKDPNGTVAAWRIFEKYVAYCIEKGYRKPQNQREFNNMLKVNYEVEKKNKHDDETKNWVCWVWVLGIKPKNLSDLSNLSEVSLSAFIEKSCGKLDKLDKSDKSNSQQPLENLAFGTIIEAPETDKTKQPVTELRTGDLIGDIQAFFEPYIRMGNPDTKTEMDWRTMTAISQLTTKLGKSREQAEQVWNDYCKQWDWPSPRPQLENGTTSPVSAPAPVSALVSAPAPAPATPVVKPTSKIEAVPISADACGICGQPLDGQASEFIGIRLGTIHRKCKHKPTKVRALTNHQYISPETHTLVKRVKGEVFELPAIEALELIRLGLVERVEK